MQMPYYIKMPASAVIQLWFSWANIDSNLLFFFVILVLIFMHTFNNGRHKHDYIYILCLYLKFMMIQAEFPFFFHFLLTLSIVFAEIWRFCTQVCMRVWVSAYVLRSKNIFGFKVEYIEFASLS